MDSQFFDYLQKIPIIKSLLSNTSLIVGIGAGLTVLLLAVFIRTLFYIWNYAIRSASQQTGTTSDDTNDWDWFGPNKAKIQYQECLVNTPENTGDLKKLLRERALEIVRRIRKVEEEKEALGKLYKNGSISQTMWESLKRAEKNAQLEIFEIQAEADTFEKGTDVFIMGFLISYHYYIFRLGRGYSKRG